MSFVLPPDIEMLVRNYLADDGDVSAIAESVSTSLPSNPVFPLIVVFRVGGGAQPDVNRIDEARLQIEAWAEKGRRPQARELIQTVRAALVSDEFAGSHDEGIVIGTEEENVIYLSDAPTSRPRYVLDIRVRAHAAALVAPGS